MLNLKVLLTRDALSQMMPGQGPCCPHGMLSGVGGGQACSMPGARKMDRPFKCAR